MSAQFCDCAKAINKRKYCIVIWTMTTWVAYRLNVKMSKNLRQFHALAAAATERSMVLSSVKYAYEFQIQNMSGIFAIGPMCSHYALLCVLCGWSDDGADHISTASVKGEVFHCSLWRNCASYVATAALNGSTGFNSKYLQMPRLMLLFTFMITVQCNSVIRDLS